MRKILFCVMLGVLLLSGGAAAVTDEAAILREQAEAIGADQLAQTLPEDAADYLGELELMDSLDLDAGLGTIWGNASEDVSSFLRKGLRSALTLLSVVLLTGVVQGLYGSSGTKTANYIPLVGAMAVTAISAADLNALIGLGRSAISNINLFSKALLPTLAAAAAAGGATVSASARYVATAWFADLLITVVENLLMPLVYAYIALSAADAAFGDGMLTRLAGLIKRVTVWTLSLLLTGFSAYLSLTGIITGTTDAMAVKAAKTTISTAVPVVGGILSDVADTILAGAGVLRNAVGVFGALAVVAICLAPFLQLGIHYLFYKLASAVSGTVGSPRTVKLIDDLAGAFGIVLGMTASCALMLFISIISTISVVNTG